MVQPVRDRRDEMYEEYLQVPEHLHAEIIGGTLYVLPRPSPRHANAASVLGVEIAGPFQRGRGGPGGWWILDEPELHLDPKAPIIPDLAGWRVERMPDLPDAAFFYRRAMMRYALIAVLVVAGCKDKGATDKDDKAAANAKADIARLGAKRFNFEAFPLWQREHADKACPDKIDDLYPYVSANDRQDPWGAPYRMLCGANLPAGVHGGFAVLSLGPDGKEGTTDDIKSWEK